MEPETVRTWFAGLPPTRTNRLVLAGGEDVGSSKACVRAPPCIYRVLVSGYTAGWVFFHVSNHTPSREGVEHTSPAVGSFKRIDFRVRQVEFFAEYADISEKFVAV